MNDITVTPYREFTLRAFAAEKPGAELVTLLAQLMRSYDDMPPNEVNGVVDWFSATYRRPPSTPKQGEGE